MRGFYRNRACRVLSCLYLGVCVLMSQMRTVVSPLPLARCWPSALRRNRKRGYGTEVCVYMQTLMRACVSVSMGVPLSASGRARTHYTRVHRCVDVECKPCFPRMQLYSHADKDTRICRFTHNSNDSAVKGTKGACTGRACSGRRLLATDTEQSYRVQATTDIHAVIPKFYVQHSLLVTGNGGGAAGHGAHAKQSLWLV